MRRSLLLILLWTVVGCSSFTPTPNTLAVEVLTTQPPSSDFRRITTDIHVDQAVLDAMRRRASSMGIHLLAVARIPRGIHPYAVLAWCQTGDTIEIRETALYWGRVDGKWHTPSTAEELAALAAAARTEFECAVGPAAGAVYGTGFVTWEGDRQITCEGSFFAEEGSVFWSGLEEIYARDVQTYTAFEDAPPD